MAKINVKDTEITVVQVIAFEFAMWITPEFKIYIVKEFQRLKEEEQKLLGWSAKRELAKINYRIHTDAIKQHLIPPELTPQQKSFVYADEADMLNVAMFGMTAKQWREANPELKGNIRDYATINQLICLSNMENLNAVFINDGLPQSDATIKNFLIVQNEGSRQVSREIAHYNLQMIIAVGFKVNNERWGMALEESLSNVAPAPKEHP